MAAYPVVFASAGEVVSGYAAEQIAKGIVLVAMDKGARTVGSSHDVAVDVGEAKDRFSCSSCLGWAHGQQNTTRQFDVFFGDLPSCITHVVWGVTRGCKVVV